MASRIKIWVDDEILYAVDLNAEFDNVLSQSVTPDSMDDCAEDALAMQTAADPYPGGSVSLPTSLRGEIHRLRYLIKQITGETYWYVDPDTSLASLLAARNARNNIYDANTILAADTDNTPAAVTVEEDRIVGRIAGGNITALTLTQLLDMIGSCAVGDILYRDSSGWTRLPKGTLGHFLKQGANHPEWGSVDGNKGAITVSGSGATFAINNNTISQANLVNYAPGYYPVWADLTGGSTTSYGMTKITGMRVARTGTVRVRFTLRGTAWTAYGQIYVNGAARGTTRTAGTSALTYDEDIAVNPGDLVAIYARHSDMTGSNIAYVTNFQVMTSVPLNEAEA
jgi:hypothetical protein